MALKVYFLDENNSLVKIPFTRWERLRNYDTKETFPEYTGKRLKRILVFVDMENRQPIEISHIEGSYITFDENGKLSKKEENEHLRRASEIFIDILDNGEQYHTNDKLIDASKIFKRRAFDNKYRFDISNDIINKITNDVFCKSSKPHKSKAEILREKLKRKTRKAHREPVDPER